MKNKNIHIFPTDKPSRLVLDTVNKNLFLTTTKDFGTKIMQFQNIYITSDEEIKEGDWVLEKTTLRIPYIGKTFYPKNDGTVTEEILKRDLLSVNYKGHYETLASKRNCEKIILTTDPDLIKDGVQAIDDEFLEWFVQNPSCEEVEVENQWEGNGTMFGFKMGNNSPDGKFLYKIIIPKEEQCTCKEHDPYCCQIHGNCPTCVKKEEPKHSTMKKQSSIDWLIESIFSHFGKGWLTDQIIKDEIEQAKAMHKEEIEEAYHTAQLELIQIFTDEFNLNLPVESDREDAEQYYSETFE